LSRSLSSSPPELLAPAAAEPWTVVEEELLGLVEPDEAGLLDGVDPEALD